MNLPCYLIIYNREDLCIIPVLPSSTSSKSVVPSSYYGTDISLPPERKQPTVIYVQWRAAQWEKFVTNPADTNLIRLLYFCPQRQEWSNPPRDDTTGSTTVLSQIREALSQFPKVFLYSVQIEGLIERYYCRHATHPLARWDQLV